MPYKAQIQATLGGAAPTLAEYLAGLNGGLWLHDYADTVPAVSGALTGARVVNRMYTAGLGPELLTNRIAPFAFSSGNPTNWTVSETNPNSSIEEGDNGSIRFISDGTLAQMHQGSTVVGVTYRAFVRLEEYVDGEWSITDSAGSPYYPRSNGDSITLDYIALFGHATLGFGIKRNLNPPHDFSFAEFSWRKLSEYDGNLLGTALLAQGGGQAIALDGSTAYETVANGTSLNGLAEATIWLVIRPDTLTDGDRLIWKNGELDVYLNANGSIHAHRDYSTGDADTDTAAGVIEAGKLYAVAVHWNNTDKIIHINVNGVNVDSGTPTAGVGTAVSNTNILQLWKNNSTNAFDGLAYASYQAGRELTSDELLTLYQLTDT